MGISLKKGGRINLSKEAPSLDKMTVGLGWDANQSDTGGSFDLDASIFLVGANGKTASDSDFIFYNNLKSTDGSVHHQGDNLTGAGDGDDEKINITLSGVNDLTQEIIFVVTIHDAEIGNKNFGQVSNAFIRIVDDVTGNEIMKYDLDEDYSTETAIEFGKLYRRDGTWRFQAVGTGFNAGLQGFVDKYTG
ncbi:MAG: TerD family protein [Cocleimonas sp.]|nr:TerD family protein [Cocleimonas sp.]